MFFKPNMKIKTEQVYTLKCYKYKDESLTYARPPKRNAATSRIFECLHFDVSKPVELFLKRQEI